MIQDRIILPAWGLCPSSTTLCETVGMRICEKASAIRYPFQDIWFSLKSFYGEFFKEVFENTFYSLNNYFVEKDKEFWSKRHNFFLQQLRSLSLLCLLILHWYNCFTTSSNYCFSWCDMLHKKLHTLALLQIREEKVGNNLLQVPVFKRRYYSHWLKDLMYLLANEQATPSALVIKPWNNILQKKMFLPLWTITLYFLSKQRSFCLCLTIFCASGGNPLGSRENTKE